MGRITNLDSILQLIKERGLFRGIQRYQYLNYDVEASIELIEAIGKKRNPKFCIDDENRFTYENLIRWCHCDSEMKCIDPETKKVIPGNLKCGIFIAGNTGSGKSWTLEIMAAYAMVWNFQIELGEDIRCLYWGNVRTDVICDEYTEIGSFDRFKRMSILGIQDLGSEPVESMYMGNRQNVLRQIIEYRGDRTDQLTLITSNFSMLGKNLKDYYGDRVASRLQEMCNYFEIKGVDRRKL